MKRYYEKYTIWEDYNNGMYDFVESNDALIKKAALVLSNPNIFSELCKRVINEWKISSLINLSNTSCNRKAWLGQASCCIKYKIPEVITRYAWSTLDKNTQDIANSIADEYILLYEQGLKELQNISKIGKKGAIRNEYQMKLPLDWKIYEKFLLIDGFVKLY